MDKNSLRGKLATLSVAIADARKATFLDRIRRYEACLALALDLLGALVDRVEPIQGRPGDKSTDIFPRDTFR